MKDVERTNNLINLTIVMQVLPALQQHAVKKKTINDLPRVYSHRNNNI